MKRTISHIILLLAIIVMATSCEKMSDNGKLDGMWHLKEIHTRTGANTSAAYTEHHDVSETGVYWCFQLQLLYIRSATKLNGETTETMCRFNYNDTQLDVTQAYIHYRDHDNLVTDQDTHVLDQLGIRSNATSFRIERLSNHHMTLCSDKDSLVFQKI